MGGWKKHGNSVEHVVEVTVKRRLFLVSHTDIHTKNSIG